jgi:hypothetical protein
VRGERDKKTATKKREKNEKRTQRGKNLLLGKPLLSEIFSCPIVSTVSSSVCHHACERGGRIGAKLLQHSLFWKINHCIIIELSSIILCWIAQSVFT